MLQQLWAPRSPLTSRHRRGAGSSRFGMSAGRSSIPAVSHPELSVSRQALAGARRLCLSAGRDLCTDGRTDTPAGAARLCQLPGGATEEGFSVEGSPRAALTSLISASFQRLLERLGGRAVSTPGCHYPSILKISPHITCPA